MSELPRREPTEFSDGGSGRKLRKIPAALALASVLSIAGSSAAIATEHPKPSVGAGEFVFSVGCPAGSVAEQFGSGDMNVWGPVVGMLCHGRYGDAAYSKEACPSGASQNPEDQIWYRVVVVSGKFVLGSTGQLSEPEQLEDPFPGTLALRFNSQGSVQVENVTPCRTGAGQTSG